MNFKVSVKVRLKAGVSRRVSAGFLVVVVLCLTLVFVAPAMAEFGLSKFAVGFNNQNGTPDVQAGSHPYSFTTSFVFNLPSERGKWEGDVKNVELQLPPGFAGDPDATPRCTYQEFSSTLEGGSGACPNDTAVGFSTSYLGDLNSPGDASAVSYPVYNLVPPRGVAAEFGFIVSGKTPVLLATSVRTGRDYGLDSGASNVIQAAIIAASKVTIWGVPAATSHNPWRGSCLYTAKGSTSPIDTVGFGLREGEEELEGPLHYAGSTPEEDEGVAESACEAPAEQEMPLPLLTNPTSCGVPRTATLNVENWEEERASRTVSLPPLTGCENLEFNPKIEVKPGSEAGSTPTGLNVDLKVPQEGTESAEGRAEATVKDTTLTLPAAMRLNASAVDGLQACSIPQVGFERFEELPSVPGVQSALYGPGAPSCPEPSKLANVRIKSPDLEGELEGGVYLASPQNFPGVAENPFSSLLAMYLIAEEPKTGVLVKLAGKVTPNLETGQLTTSFESTPQLPFSDLKLEFFTGERASLSTPTLCGTYTTEATFTPWSGTPPVTRTSSFQVASGPGGSACTSPQQFAPSMTAGTSDINAGAFSGQLTTVISRQDADQALGSVQVKLPGGLAGIIAGVPQCGETEANAGTCPQSSEIGETTASVGLGNDPYTVTGGKVYLTGPYQGAPFGLSIVTPAVAGPFNLGNVIVRAKIEINPRTAQVTVSTGALPHIIDGIPLEIKHVNVTINRPGFAFNPTSCEPLQITGTVTSDESISAAVSSPFQAANCANLKFTPTVSVATGSHASKADGASLSFKIAYPQGALGAQAWVNETKFVIPRQLPARLTTLQQACLQATFETNRAACPVHSKIGTAVVHTQVLPVPLEGPVYFVSYGNAKFPDVVIALSGDNVNVELIGETYIHDNITSATFTNLPDVPFENVEVNLPTGEYSEFGAYTSAQHPYQLCGVKLNVPTFFKAQNGLEIHQETPVAVNNCPTTPSIQSTTLKKHTLTLTVYVPAAGKLKITAPGLTTTTKTTHGQELLTLNLHTNKNHKFKTKLHLTYTPTHGHKQTTTHNTQA
jgi:hypothetical protein